MHFNFHENFRQLANADLLKIVRQADEYQPAAVQAATDILQERKVPESDIVEVDNFFTGKLAAEQKKIGQRQVLKEQVVDFIEPLLKPDQEIKPAKWLKILLVVIAVQFIWENFYTVSALVYALWNGFFRAEDLFYFAL